MDPIDPTVAHERTQWFSGSQWRTLGGKEDAQLGSGVEGRRTVGGSAASRDAAGERQGGSNELIVVEPTYLLG